MKESQLDFLMMFLCGFGAIVVVELWSIGHKLHKIYEAIGTWGVSIESKIGRLK